MRSWSVVVTVLVGFVCSSLGWARSPDDLLVLGYTTGTEADMSLPRPHVLAETLWPRSLLTAFHDVEKTLGTQDNCSRRKAMAFHGGRFLASDWACDDGQLFILYRLSNGRLKPLVTVKDFHVALVEPSGMDVFPDHVPAVFVDVGSGGSGFEGYGQQVFRIEAGGVRDVTPAWRTVWVDLVDGRLVAMSSDDRWANFFRGCGQCPPFIPIVQEWRGGAFRMACKRLPALIDERAADYERMAVDEENRVQQLNIVEARLNKTLLLLQAGRGVEGLAEFEAVTALLQRNIDPQIVDFWQFLIRSTFTDVVARAALPSAAQCPLSATPAAGYSPGLEARAQRFRPKAQPSWQK
ncbi:MAG: hypothetical protein HYU59_10100 [Magnetospirillum gryphiswaldense]|nr:hypothetical protein [Magnetospirillum gryphiswaldense]